MLDAAERGQLSGNGHYTRLCHAHIENMLTVPKALLTHSCTAALEMAAILSDLAAGDEVIMPSFTFVSTANAVALRGAVPVFVDIRHDTLNIDETLIEGAISTRTKAICVVHYGGVGCRMDMIGEIAAAHGLVVIEDAAHAFGATWNGRLLGTFGGLAAFSFHETKNVISGEGGALVVNDPALIDRAEVIWEKGTNRAQFARGEVARYTWIDIGSSFLPSELTAAFLWAQLQAEPDIKEKRRRLWRRYHAAFADLANNERLMRPVDLNSSEHAAHVYYILVRTPEERAPLLDALKERNIKAVIHYVPLHSSPAGVRLSRTAGPMTVTEDVSARIVRLPLFPDLTDSAQDHVIDAVQCLLGKGR